jgi:thiol-disulfide isomerase/thioredoxin
MTMWPLFLVVSLASGSVQTPASQPTTPDECVKAARAFTQTSQRAVERITAEVVRRINADKVDMARACAAQFDPKTIDASQIADLIALYGEADQRDLATATLTRALGLKSLAAPARAKVLAQAVLTGLSEPKSSERNARLEGYIDALDRVAGDELDPHILDSKISAHARIIKQSTWLIERAKAFTPEQRRQYGSTIISAHINMAEALAGRGQNNRANELLREAKSSWGDIPNAARMIDPNIARYALIGTPAAPIAAQRWLNAPANTRLAMTGAVTLLEFTAHWCGPCKESYPGVKRLLATYGDQGFRVVLSTELYGYFGAERPLTAEAEFERDREYFAEEGLNVPVAVGNQRPPSVRGADGTYTYFKDPNMAAYEVGGIPQLHLIDKQGRIRLIMVGYDDVNEPFVAAQIEKLLKEK